MKKIILTLLLGWLLVGNIHNQAVLAVTIDFQWSGNQGYIAKGSFSYDQTTAPTIFSEKGSGKMRVLENFQVSFYDGSGQEIAKYDNVNGGVSTADYFQFNFNAKTGQVFGSVDLGGEGMGEIYLKGVVKDNLTLFRVESGDVVMDEDDSPEIIIQSWH
jgi:hypothetical protein